MMYLNALVNLPSASTLFSDMATTSSPTWDNLYPISVYALGITIGASLIGFLIFAIGRAVGSLWNRGD